MIVSESPALASELAATLLQAGVTIGVAVLCVHLYVRYRRSWFGWFAIAWGVYVARLMCILSFLLTDQRIWLYWHQVTTGWTALALLWASLVFSRQFKPRAIHWSLVLFPPLWSYIAIYELDHFLWAALPAVVFLSGATCWTGWVFWRHYRIAHSTGARVLAVSFFLWGLHHLDYPFLRAEGAWTPWGYYLDISFVLLVASGLVLLVLDDLGRGMRALSALSGDLQRRASSQLYGVDPFDTLLVRPLALPGVRGVAMFLFDSEGENENAFDNETSSKVGDISDATTDILDRVLAQVEINREQSARGRDEYAKHSETGANTRTRTNASVTENARIRGTFISGAGVCASWSGGPVQHEVYDALARMRLERRPQIVAASGEQPFVAVLPVEAGSQLIGALVMVGEVRNPFTALDDNFLRALGQQVGAAIDQWALDRQLISRTHALERLSTRMVKQHEEERRRLSRELHDETAQVFSAVKMQLESLRPLLAEEAGPRLDRTLALVDTGIASIRQVTSDLRPTLLDDLGLRPALHSLVADFIDRTGIQAVFRAPRAFPQLEKDADLAVFRALQEALSNVVRHSGATKVEITATVTEQALTLIIQDNGCGFPVTRTGKVHETEHRMGLTGMRERLHAVKGSLAVSNSASGFALHYATDVSPDSASLTGARLIITVPLRTGSGDKEKMK